MQILGVMTSWPEPAVIMKNSCNSPCISLDLCVHFRERKIGESWRDCFYALYIMRPYELINYILTYLVKIQLELEQTLNVGAGNKSGAAKVCGY